MLPDCVPNACAFPIAAFRSRPVALGLRSPVPGRLPGARVPDAFGLRSARVSRGTCVPDRAFRIARSGRRIATAFRGTTKYEAWKRFVTPVGKVCDLAWLRKRNIQRIDDLSSFALRRERPNFIVADDPRGR